MTIDALKIEDVILCCLCHFLVHPPTVCSSSSLHFNPLRSRRSIARFLLQILQVRLGLASSCLQTCDMPGNFEQNKDLVLYHSWPELKDLLSKGLGGLGTEVGHQVDEVCMNKRM